ncbi:UNVERIFIED_CONTAM: hypothetical protein K2H54_068665 [Gekko kuhli]
MGASPYSPAVFARLVLLLPALVAALHCDSLQQRQRMLNSQISELLRQGGASVPPECLAQLAAFNFPAKNLTAREPHLARGAAYEILRGFLGLLSSNPGQTGQATATQHRLLNALHAQSKRLQRCFGGDKTKPPSPDETSNKLILRRYFREIRIFLEEKSRSPCAGIVVQLGVRAWLPTLDALTQHMND